MSDWKIGDKVFCFWHANDCSLVWDLEDFSVEEDEIVGFNHYGNPMITGHYDFRLDIELKQALLHDDHMRSLSES